MNNMLRSEQLLKAHIKCSQELFEEHIKWSERLFEEHIKMVKGVANIDDTDKEQKPCSDNTSDESSTDDKTVESADEQIRRSSNWIENHIRNSGERLQNHIKRASQLFEETDTKK